MTARAVAARAVTDGAVTRRWRALVAGARGLAVLVALAAGCAPAASPTSVPYRVLELGGVEAPALPPPCRAPGAEEAAAGQRTLVVFSASWCDACRTLLRELHRDRARLEAAGYAVRELVADAADCPAATMTAASHGGFPASPADEPLLDAWRVDALPVTYVVADGLVERRAEGVMPLAVLLGHELPAPR